MNPKSRRFFAGIFVFSFILFTAVQVTFAGARRAPFALDTYINVFGEAMRLIQKNYIRDVSPKDLVYAALERMLESLDPHSHFLSPDDLMRLETETDGEFVGIGAKVKLLDGALSVVNVLAYSPAEQADIRPEDQIVEIDYHPVSELERTEALSRLKGKPGEIVALVIKREGESHLLEKVVRRERVDIPSVKDARVITEDIAYVRIIKFASHTRKDLLGALDSLRSQGRRKLIIDLRDNPGGTLEAAGDVTSLFLKKGELIVSIQSRNDPDPRRITSVFPTAFVNMPLAVLINGESASASEVMAAALRDHGRAVLIGSKSFGKGSIQMLIKLSDGSAMRLTTAEYITPAGAHIHGKGLTPDIEAGGLKEALEKAVAYLKEQE